MFKILITFILATIYFILSNVITRSDLKLLSSNFADFLQKAQFMEGVTFLITDHIIIMSLFFIVVLFTYLIGASKSPIEFINKFKALNLSLLPMYQVTRILSLVCWPMRDIIPFNSLLLVPIIIPISLIKTKIIKSYMAKEDGEMNSISRLIVQIITILCTALLVFLIPFFQSFIKKTYLSSL